MAFTAPAYSCHYQPPASPHLLLCVHDVPLGQLLQLDVGVVGLGLHLLLELQPVFVHLGLQLVLQGDQLLLVLPSHALVAGHLLPQLALLLMFVDLLGYLAVGVENHGVRA